MKAICSKEIGMQNVSLEEIERPAIQPDHILVKVSEGAINHGDVHWLKGEIPRGLYQESTQGVAGASSGGVVVKIGENVPRNYQGCKVAYYRSLNPSEYKVGCWSEYALMHYLDCIILPNEADVVDYCGSVVNIMTAYAFYKTAGLNPQKGVIATAGESLTGKALLGVAQEKNIPIISIVRDEVEKERLELYSAEHILVQKEENFDSKLETLSQELNTTTVFDGVGGSILTRIIPLLPPRSTTYSYGFLGTYCGDDVVNFQTATIFGKTIRLDTFGVMKNETTLNQDKLRPAIDDLKGFVHKPHFRVETGQVFAPEEFKEAIEFTANPKNKGKAVFKF
jgi:NADPH:quinone reductase-like Zn-dependent oxidoreductase